MGPSSGTFDDTSNENFNESKNTTSAPCQGPCCNLSQVTWKKLLLKAGLTAPNHLRKTILNIGCLNETYTIPQRKRKFYKYFLEPKKKTKYRQESLSFFVLLFPEFHCVVHETALSLLLQIWDHISLFKKSKESEQLQLQWKNKKKLRNKLQAKRNGSTMVDAECKTDSDVVTIKENLSRSTSRSPLRPRRTPSPTFQTPSQEVDPILPPHVTEKKTKIAVARRIKWRGKAFRIYPGESLGLGRS